MKTWLKKKMLYKWNISKWQFGASIGWIKKIHFSYLNTTKYYANHICVPNSWYISLQSKLRESAKISAIWYTNLNGLVHIYYKNTAVFQWEHWLAFEIFECPPGTLGWYIRLKKNCCRFDVFLNVWLLIPLYYREFHEKVLSATCVH